MSLCQGVCVQVCVHRNVDGHRCAQMGMGRVCVCSDVCAGTSVCADMCAQRWAQVCVQMCEQRRVCIPVCAQPCTHTGDCPEPPALPTLAAGPAEGHPGERRRAGRACNAGTRRVSACVSVCPSACARPCPCPCVAVCVSPRVPAPGPAPALPITRRPL